MHGESKCGRLWDKPFGSYGSGTIFTHWDMSLMTVRFLQVNDQKFPIPQVPEPGPPGSRTILATGPRSLTQLLWGVPERRRRSPTRRWRGVDRGHLGVGGSPSCYQLHAICGI